MCARRCVVAGEPGEVEPVPHLQFQVRPVGLARLVPERALVPVAAADAARRWRRRGCAHRLQVAVAVTPLGAAHDGQVLRLAARRCRAPSGCPERPPQRLLREDVLARGQPPPSGARPEARGRGQDDVVGVVAITSRRSRATNMRSAGTSIMGARLGSLRRMRHWRFQAVPWEASPMATIFTPDAALRTLAAAPVAGAAAADHPDPDGVAASAPGARYAGEARVPTAAAVEVFRKSRREGGLGESSAGS